MYRVAHNVSASYIMHERRTAGRLVELDVLEAEPGSVDDEARAYQRYSVSKLIERIYRLKTL